jgi:hypothetical protein
VDLASITNSEHAYLLQGLTPAVVSVVTATCSVRLCTAKHASKQNRVASLQFWHVLQTAYCRLPADFLLLLSCCRRLQYSGCCSSESNSCRVELLC